MTKHLSIDQAAFAETHGAAFMAAVWVLSGVDDMPADDYRKASGTPPGGETAVDRLAWCKFLHRQCEMGKNILEKAIKKMESK